MSFFKKPETDSIKAVFFLFIIFICGYFVVNELRHPGFLAQVFTFKGRTYQYQGVQATLPAPDYVTKLYTDTDVVMSTEKYGVAKDKNGVDEDLYLDVYTVPSSAITGFTKGTSALKRPVAIYVQGGAFCNASKSASGAVKWSKWFAERGWIGISMDYRQRCPGNDTQQTGIAQKEAGSDVMAAVRFVRTPEVQAKYGIDLNKIVLVGSSAGAISILMADISSEIAGDFANQSGFSDVAENVSNNPTTIPSWVCFAIAEAGSVTTGYLNNWLDMAHDAPAIDIHSVDDETIAYSEGKKTMQAWSDEGILPVLNLSTVTDAFLSADISLPIIDPINLITITDPDGGPLKHGEYYKVDEEIEEILFPILDANVIEGSCPTPQMTGVSPL